MVEQEVFLSRLKPERRELRLVRGFVVLSILTGVVLAPIAPTPWAQIPAFIPLYESALSISDFVTAILLFGQIVILRSRALLVLAAAYLFTALMQIPHLLSFPGAFSPTGLMGAGPQTTAWLYIVWHGGFPLAVIAYAFIKAAPGRPERLLANAPRAVLQCVAVVMALLAASILLTTWGHALLPPVMKGDTKSVEALIGFETTWALSIVALAALAIRRPYAVLDLWLMVVMSAWVCDGALSSVFNVGRYDLGFYIGRAFGFLAANFVLVVLLLGTSKLYGRVLASKAQADAYAHRLEGRVEESQQEIERSQKHLALAQHVALLGSTELDLKTGQFHWSDEFYHLLGLDPQSAAPGLDTFLTVLASEDHDQARRVVNQIRQGLNVAPYEIRVKRADGQTRWLYRVNEVVRDAGGTATKIVSTFQDITERKSLEVDLELSREALNRAQVVGQLGSSEFDVKTGTMVWSDNMRRLLGIAPGEPPTMEAFLAVLPPEGHAQAREFAGLVRQGKGFEPYEFRVLKDSEERWFYRVTEVFNGDDGAPRLVVSTIQDITERKRIVEAQARAEAATAAKSSFLANMSHEIRTPMNAVIGLSDLALKTELTVKQQDYLVKIKSSAMALLGILNDILDFSKIEAGKLRLESADFDLRAVLDNVSTVSSLRAADKGLELLFSVDPELPTLLVGDSLRLGQILLNLVSNGIKFTERGEIVVEVHVVSRRADAIELSFSVSDTGIGMDADTMARLFRPFTQADSSTTRRFGGTGLGLTISRQLVEMMGGTIAADSKPGAGTTFRFNLRLGISARAEDFGRLVVSAFSGLRALVIDDSMMARRIVESMLTHWGLAVDSAASGAEGLEAVRRHAAAHRSYDLLVVDWRMPNLDGVDTVRSILAEPMLTKSPAVVLMTAYGRDDLMEQARDTKVDAFLAKPMTASTLLDTISTALSPVARGPVPQRKAAATLDPGLVRGIRVLLVDDNDVNRQVGEETLVDAGVIVDLAHNGQIAVHKALADGARYDAILMDVQMPVMDGLEASRTIRKRFSAEQLPIIALTANAMTEERQTCLDAGMNDHVAKPIEPRVLIETLARWVKPVEREPQPLPVAHAPPQPSKPAASAPSADDLPVSLPPFDIASALVRVNGKRPILRRLFLSFGEEFAAAIPDIRRALDDGKAKDAERVAHSLKSAAATLGAGAVSSAAAVLERDLRQEQSANRPVLIADLDAKLTTALQAIATLKPSAT